MDKVSLQYLLRPHGQAQLQCKAAKIDLHPSLISLPELSPASPYLRPDAATL